MNRLRETVARRSDQTQPRGQKHPGWFIAIEGGDGAGKSTQIAALATWLRKRGFEVVTTREPGGTEVGARLREILLHARDQGPVGARAEALLFAADRAEHIEKVVRPALVNGAVVVTDRHVDSSIAYQSGGRGLSADDVVALSAFATKGLRPDLTVLLDLDPAIAWERSQTRADAPDKLEAEPAEFHARVRSVFRARAAADPGRYLVVDAAEPVGVVTAIIEDRLEKLLPLSAREALAAEETERSLRAAREAEEREQRARKEAERAEAERRAEQRRAEEAAERQDAERRRAEAEKAAQELAAEEHRRQAALEEEKRRQEEADQRAAALREKEERMQVLADAERRRENEMAVRKAEALAKARARDQAIQDLAVRALPPGDTKAVPVDLSQTQVLPNRGDVDTDEDDEDDDAPRGRWRLGRRKRREDDDDD
jgi:dTMP kinase